MRAGDKMHFRGGGCQAKGAKGAEGAEGAEGCGGVRRGAVALRAASAEVNSRDADRPLAMDQDGDTRRRGLRRRWSHNRHPRRHGCIQSGAVSLAAVCVRHQRRGVRRPYRL